MRRETQQLEGYYLYYPNPSLMRRMDIFLFSGRRILGIPNSPRKLGILHRRRQLLLPTLHMEEIVNFLVDKKKEGRETT